MNVSRCISRLSRRPRYRLATLFAVITFVSLPLAFWGQREHEYRLRLAALAVLLEDEGGTVWVEEAGGGSKSRHIFYAILGRTLPRSDVVVQASCDSSDRDISAVLNLPTLRKLTISDVPTGRFEDLHIEFPPGFPEEEKEAALLSYSLWKAPVPPPTGSIDGAVRRIVKLPALEELDLSRTSVSDEGVRSLARAHRLRALNLSDTKTTDAAVEHLCSLHEIEGLNLDSTGVTDKGVRCLAAFPSLRALTLSGTAVTGIGFENLSCLGALETLDLSKTPFTDGGVRHLAAIRSLRELNLNQTKISADALVHLSSMLQLSELSLWVDDIGDSLEGIAGLPKLKRLSLRAARISDAGLKALAKSRSLEKLDLDECAKISDAGIAHLTRIASLRKVTLYHATRVTAAGVTGLKRLRPDLNVGWVSEADFERARASFIDLNRPFTGDGNGKGVKAE